MDQIHIMHSRIHLRYRIRITICMEIHRCSISQRWVHPCEISLHVKYWPYYKNSMQIKSEHCLLRRFKYFCSILCMSSFIFNAGSIILDLAHTSYGHTGLQRCPAIFQILFYPLALHPVVFYLSLKTTPKMLHWIQVRCHIWHGHSFLLFFSLLLRNLHIILAESTSSLSCKKYSSTAKLPETGMHLIRQYFSVSTDIHGAPSYTLLCASLLGLCIHW